MNGPRRVFSRVRGRRRFGIVTIRLDVAGLMDKARERAPKSLSRSGCDAAPHGLTKRALVSLATHRRQVSSHATSAKCINVSFGSSCISRILSDFVAHLNLWFRKPLLARARNASVQRLSWLRLDMSRYASIVTGFRLRRSHSNKEDQPSHHLQKC